MPEPFGSLAPGDPSVDAMTHYPEGPSPAEPYLDATRAYFRGGVPEAMRSLGYTPPAWMDALGGVINNPDAQFALEIAGGWTPDKVATLLKLAGEGKSLSAIADEMGVSLGTVAGKMKRLKDNPPSQAGSIDANKIRDMWFGGMNKAEIARQLGVHPSSIDYQLRKLPLAQRMKQPGMPGGKSLTGPAPEMDDAELAEYAKIFGSLAPK